MILMKNQFKKSALINYIFNYVFNKYFQHSSEKQPQ